MDAVPFSHPPPLPPRPTVKAILSGEFLDSGAKGAVTEKQMADLLAPLAGLPGGAFLLSIKLGEALGERLHLKCAKTAEHEFPFGYVPVVRAMALALASLKNEMTAAFDTPRGAVMEAKMSVDFISMGGVMLFELREINPVCVRVIAQSEIKGQWFDWGKSTKALQRVFDKTGQYLAMLAPASGPGAS